VSQTKRLDGVLEGGLIGLLLFAPVPFGSSVPWAQAVIEGWVAVLCALWMIRMLVSGEIGIRLTPLLWPGLAMAALAGLQLLRPAGSVSPYATWESFRLYVAYFGFLLLLHAHLATRERIVRLLWVLIGWGVLLAGLGLTNRILERDVILWVPKYAYGNRLTSTFINANHQAFYFVVLIFLAVGLLLRPPRRTRVSARQGTGAGVLRGDGTTGGLVGQVLLGGAIVVMSAAMLLTASRGGFVSALVGLLVVFVLSLHGRARSHIPLALVGAVTMLVVYATWVGLDAVVERFSVVGREPFADVRWAVWEGAIRLVGDAPVLGIGLGGFQDAFPVYRPRAIAAQLIDYAHNDYLQLLAEAGLVGFLVMVWGLVGMTVFVLRRWVARQDPFVRGLTMGGLGALSAVVVHSAIDFSLHIPANALLLAVVSALLPAVVTLRVHRAGERVDLPEWRRVPNPRVRAAGAVAVAGVVAVVSIIVVPAAVADWRFQRAAEAAGLARRSQGAVTLGDLVAAQRDLEAAVWWEPWNPRTQAALAVVSDELVQRVWILGVTPDGRRLPPFSVEARLEVSHGLVATAYDAYQQSLRYRPRSSETHDRFGWFLGSLETVRQSVRGTSGTASLDPRLATVVESEESLITRAVAHLRQAVQWDPNNAHRHRSLALFALTKLTDDSGGHGLAAEAFRQALAIEPALLGTVVDDLTTHRAHDDLLAASVPRQYSLVLELARELERRGRRRAASTAFQDALSLASAPMQQTEARLAYGRALLGSQDSPGALAQARQALILGARSPEVFALLGDIYESTKQFADAEAALVSAVGLAATDGPGRTDSFRSRLAALLARRGEGERALALWRQVLQSAPNDPLAHLETGRLLEQRGDFSGALQEYKAAQGLAPNNGHLHREVAQAFSRAGHLTESAAAYEMAVRLLPAEGDLRVELAELYARIGWRERAIEEYRQVLARQPDHEAAKRGLMAAGVQPTGTTKP